MRVAGLGYGEKPRLPRDLAAKDDYARYSCVEIQFAKGTSRAYVEAVKLAERQPTYRLCREGIFAHRVAYSMADALHALDQLNLVSRLPHRIVYQGTDEIGFEELRPSLMCLIKRYEAEDSEDYCTGQVASEGFVYLCHQSGVRGRGFPEWIYDYIQEKGDGQFSLDVVNFRLMVLSRLERYRFCPFAQGEFVRAAMEKLARDIASGKSLYIRYLDPIAHRDEPSRRQTNYGDKPLFQRVCAFHRTCGRCAPFHGVVHDGTETVVPLVPIHPDCSCVDRKIPRGQSSKGLPTLYEIYPRLSLEKRTGILGAEVRELVDAGAVSLVDVFRMHRVRNLWELARDMNLFALSALGLSEPTLAKLRDLKSKANLFEKEEADWEQAIRTSARQGIPPEVAKREAAYRLLGISKKKGIASPTQVYRDSHGAPKKRTLLEMIKSRFRRGKGRSDA